MALHGRKISQIAPQGSSGGFDGDIEALLAGKEDHTNILTNLSNSAGDLTDGYIFYDSGSGEFNSGQVQGVAPILVSNSIGPVAAVELADNGIGLNHLGSAVLNKLKKPLLLTFLLGETPSGTGDHDAVISIPYDPSDGTTSLTFNVRRLTCWVQTASSGTTTFQVKRSTGTGAFSGSNMMSSGLSITGGSTYLAHTETFSTTQVNSGDRVRLNFSALDGTHAKFEITLLLEATA